MESLLHVNDSVTVSTGFVNSSFTTAQAVALKETFKWTDAEISRLIQIVFRPILLAFGSAGNCLSFYIMRRTSLKDVSSCFYMAVLALADIG